jgi:hypothetical protein
MLSERMNDAATDDAMMIAHKTGASIINARKRGTTKLRTGSIPMTRRASSSSRIARAPRSDAIADAAAPPMSSPDVIGAPCRTMPTPLAAPTSEFAPTWLIRPEIQTATIAPNGMAIMIAGSAVTL